MRQHPPSAFRPPPSPFGIPVPDPLSLIPMPPMNKDTWMAMLAADDEQLPDLDDVADFLQTTWPESEPITSVSSKGNIVTFALGEATAALTLFPMPIPWQHLEGPCATAWYWPGAAAALRRHRRHVLVTLIDESRDPIEKSLRLTRLVAAFTARCEQALGIFWGPGRMVHPPQAFLDLSQDMTREYLPLYLWIDFRVEAISAGTYRLYTTGLEPLGQREIEVERYEGDPQKLLETVYNIAHYALDQEKPLATGDTIGSSNAERIAIERTTSMFDPEQEVIRLEF